VRLVGDLTYYGRFGFSVEKTGTLVLPGTDPARLLGVEFVPDSLAATGHRAPVPVLAALTRKIRPRFVPRRIEHRKTVDAGRQSARSLFRCRFCAAKTAP
jgi:hypothetical protein